MEKIFVKSEIRYRSRLSGYSTFGIGGKAKAVIVVRDILELTDGIKHFNRYKIRYHILGGGSNTLFSTSGFDGVVLCLKGLDNVIAHGKHIYAQAGVTSVALMKVCYENGLSGLEFVSGIPGTVGGMTKMNAGAYGSEIGNFLEKVWILRRGKVVEIPRKHLKFSYRSFDCLRHDDVVLACKFSLLHAEKKYISGTARQLNLKRRASQPSGEKSCGSVFKRLKTESAAYYIDKSGLKGYIIGGAKVSEKHAGFIVNFNEANSEDVLNLVDYIQKVVYNKYRIKLQKEIEYIPF